MKTIGLLGGLSWESTAVYYRIINQGVFKARGGLNSAPLLLHNFNFQQIVDWQGEDRWDKVYGALLKAAQGLEQQGAEAVMICTNTMHKFADEIQSKLSVPLLHIADATGAKIAQDNRKTVGLLGTAFTMQEPFYADRLDENFKVKVRVPSAEDQAIIHRVIYDELSQGQIVDQSRSAYLEIIQTLVDQGAEAVVLGCTEIPLLISSEDTPVPLYDTTFIHAAAAVEFILGE